MSGTCCILCWLCALCRKCSIRCCCWLWCYLFHSDTGNRAPVSRVTGGDTSHYTMSDAYMCFLRTPSYQHLPTFADTLLHYLTPAKGIPYPGFLFAGDQQEDTQRVHSTVIPNLLLCTSVSCCPHNGTCMIMTAWYIFTSNKNLLMPTNNPLVLLQLVRVPLATQLVDIQVGNS